MKKQFLIMLLCLGSVCNLQAYDFQVDGIFYEFLSDKPGEVMVTYKDYDPVYTGRYNKGRNIASATIPATVKYQGKEYAVTMIGYGAFSDCEDLASVVIPNSVTTIEGFAFYNTVIEKPVYNAHIFAYMPPTYSGSYTMPNGIEIIAGGAFSGCEELTFVKLPKSLKEIGYGAFGGCTKIDKPLYSATVFAYLPRTYSGDYTVPKGIETIASCAFDGCGELTSVVLPKTVKSIGASAFSEDKKLNAVNLPEGLVSIGEHAFFNCHNLADIVLPNSVKSVGKNAFYHCYHNYSPICNDYIFASMPKFYKGSYIIKDGIKVIAAGAFSECSNITSIRIPSSVKQIGEGAFSGCSGIMFLTIPDGITIIEKETFHGCSKLSNIVIPQTVTKIGTFAFRYCSNLVTITIPNNVTSIEESAFAYCLSLRSVTLPSGISVIENGLFDGCKSLRSITIPEGVTRIGAAAFQRCENLGSVIIPSSVKEIENLAFHNCKNLTYFTNYSSNPQPLTDGVFVWIYDGEELDLSQCTLYVPANAVNTYKSSYTWSQFGSIEPIQ